MCCPPAMAEDLWPHVRAMARAALDKTDLGLLSDLDTDVLSGRALIWVVSGGKRIHCAAEIKSWAHLLSGVEQYAREEGCDCVRFIGRKGWKRIYPEYREIGAVFERRLDG